MIAHEWNAGLAPDIGWQIAYAVVEREVKALFAANPLYEHDTIGTSELVEALYPETYVRSDEARAARQRIFKALQALATRGLSAYAFQGPEKLNRMKVRVRPWFWRAPPPVVVEPDPRDIALHRIATEDLDAMQMQSIAADAYMGMKSTIWKAQRLTAFRQN